MKFSEIELPSNRKFGFFFTFVFAATAAYFFHSASITWAYVFVTAALIFLLITLIKSDVLLPLNKLWMRFGLLLGMIVSPIVLGIIFFGLFTPIAILMRLSGRDELRLRFSHKVSHWITRSEPIKSESFKHQF
ncbi:SxtJ family membrane protein [Amylibacter sp.]|nr:SxtJ family membrane protein [Amylibacter sp.]